MHRLLLLPILLGLIACSQPKNHFTENVKIKLFPFKSGDKAYPLLELKDAASFEPHEWRLTYLITGVPELHSEEKKYLRDSIGSFYPDSNLVKSLFLKAYLQDHKLVNAFNLSVAALTDSNFQAEKSFTLEEAKEVASVFFYCDKVNPDTSIQSKICVGFNGTKEANWTDDRLLLEAFCFEAIWREKIDSSALRDSYDKHKTELTDSLRSSISSLDQYLLDARKGLILAMKNEKALENRLIEYYEANKTNLAFKLEMSASSGD